MGNSKSRNDDMHNQTATSIHINDSKSKATKYLKRKSVVQSAKHMLHAQDETFLNEHQITLKELRIQGFI